ncbi:GNAT family N-acetyltransferase [Pseudomonas sp. CDFA 602]|uniref:GNAT family N-acetyltransferase n=1 Tax=Pseudomonas californiensis TaxID=2829823 RepID=UPI001E2A949A|nr:GNAT family N-acetyltransferase [Pseudomonas californiensis]MCD5995811.1 GNAT family N-acetyltransferase [Pseudomonas californiensis]MCD6001336.1 GNAT family N-acetyltransferase [Pseudomonas californiensis]
MTDPDALIVVLRDALPEDALCLGALGAQVFLDTYATQGIREAIAHEVFDVFSPQAMTQAITRPACILLIAESRGHLLGFAQVALDTDHDMLCTPGAAELQRLYVQERFTGKGIGHRLLEAAERRAADAGAIGLWATVWEDNVRALEFYPRKGYVLKGVPQYLFQGEIVGNCLFFKTLVGSGAKDVALL